jgi:hypothetical protein
MNVLSHDLEMSLWAPLPANHRQINLFYKFFLNSFCEKLLHCQQMHEMQFQNAVEMHYNFS